ncbi:MAG: transcription antitermination factor NusB [Helicobacter sp.]|nr:transcription antitermination factor NusB [Helicobacter sp.]
MATQSSAREAVFALLYAHDCGNDAASFAPTFLNDKNIKNAKQTFALDVFAGALEKLDEIDNAIKGFLQNWDFDRVGALEKAILRLGTFEIRYQKTPKSVVINEMITLAKKYSDKESAKFINGILDKI